MIKYLIPVIATFCASTFMVSCGDPECKNINPVFDQYSPESKEYKNELVRQLKRIDQSTLSYVLDQYQEHDSVQYLHVLFHGESLCAKGIVVVKKWDDKLEGIRKAK